MMDIGRMIRRMDLGSIRTQMALSMKAIGSMISNMEKEKSIGPMVPNMRVSTKVARKMDLDSSVGLTSQAIAVSS